MFEKKHNTSEYKLYKAEEQYKVHVEEFYSKHFKKYVNQDSDQNEEMNKNVCFALSIFLSNKHTFPNKTDSNRRFINLILKPQNPGALLTNWIISFKIFFNNQWLKTTILL